RGPVPTIDGVSTENAGPRVRSSRDRRDAPAHISYPAKVTDGYQQAADGQSSNRAAVVASLERSRREAESRQSRAGLGGTTAPLRRPPPRPIDDSSQARAERAIADIRAKASVDTGEAMQSLEGLRQSAETPMAGTVQLNTGAAEQAIDRLHNKGRSLLEMLGQVETKANNLRLPSGGGGAKSLPRASGNRRRTMPDAGIAKP
ncbi:MAG: hypothetical protein AAFO61_11430, partial [Pseudomonadota bacterium]